MSVEHALVQEDGTVIRRIYEDGQHTDTFFDTDEMLLAAREQESRHDQQAERWQKIRHPFKLVRDKIIGGLDVPAEVPVEQIASESGSHTLLEETIRGWRSSGEGHHAA